MVKTLLGFVFASTWRCCRARTGNSCTTLLFPPLIAIIDIPVPASIAASAPVKETSGLVLFLCIKVKIKSEFVKGYLAIKQLFCFVTFRIIGNVHMFFRSILKQAFHKCLITLHRTRIRHRFITFLNSRNCINICRESAYKPR